jgi:hypothetical protein
LVRSYSGFLVVRPSTEAVFSVAQGLFPVAAVAFGSAAPDVAYAAYAAFVVVAVPVV